MQRQLVLRNRAIRFDVFQGSFLTVVTPGSNVLVNSLSVNTRMNRVKPFARLSIAAGAATPDGNTDYRRQLVLQRYNGVVQQVSGAGLLTTLPSAE